MIATVTHNQSLDKTIYRTFAEGIVKARGKFVLDADGTPMVE